MKNPAILKKFSQKDPDSPVIFTGDKCVVTILQKFENYECLKVADSVTTLGVFDMEVDGIESGCFLVARVEMFPSEISNITIDDKPYVQLTFNKGDVFMRTTKFVVEEKLAFYIWLEYIKYGNVLKAMSYEDQAFLFDKIRQTSGITFPVDHVVYEAIFAYLSRDTNDPTVQYRNSKMQERHFRIQLNDVAHAARSTQARIVGANMKEGINAALDNPNAMNSQIEDLLRT
jgi:hypothetical protein